MFSNGQVYNRFWVLFGTSLVQVQTFVKDSLGFCSGKVQGFVRVLIGISSGFVQDQF